MQDDDQQHRDQEHDAPAQEQAVVDDGPDSGGDVEEPDPSIGERADENPAEGYDPGRQQGEG